jgi:hypothetical protein
VGNQNLQDLPKNITVTQLISSLPANSQCRNDSQHGPAQHVCLDCWDALCDTCSRYHIHTRFTRDHTVKLLSEVTPEDIQAHKAEQTVFCEVHPRQEVAFYCFDETCQRFVCNVCTGVRCRSHRCLDLLDADKEFITKLNESLVPIQELSTNIDSMIKHTFAAIENVSANHKAAQQDVNTLMSDAEDKLHSLFKKLLSSFNSVEIQPIRLLTSHTANR